MRDIDPVECLSYAIFILGCFSFNPPHINQSNGIFGWLLLRTSAITYLQFLVVTEAPRS